MTPGRVRIPRCVLALGAVLGVLLLLLAGTVLPWLQRSAMYDQVIEDRQNQLERYLGLIETLPGLEAQLQRVKQAQGLDAYYLAATDPSLGGVALQRLFEDMTGAAGANLTSIQILPVEEMGGLTKVSVRARVSSNTEQLSRLLYTLETSEPLLFVPQINLRSLRGARRTKAGTSRWSDELNVNLDVFGYIRRSPG